MIYPKQRMSLSELKQMGFSKYELSKIIQDPRAPVQWTPGKGKAFIDTSKLDDYLSNREIPKKKSDVKLPWSKRKNHLRQQVIQNN